MQIVYMKNNKQEIKYGMRGAWRKIYELFNLKFVVISLLVKID